MRLIVISHLANRYDPARLLVVPDYDDLHETFRTMTEHSHTTNACAINPRNIPHGLGVVPD
jgi:hypothetical protein